MSRIGFIIALFCGTLLWGCATQTKFAPELDFQGLISQAGLDRHAYDDPWLGNAMTNRRLVLTLDPPLIQRCGFYLLMNRCKNGMTLGEVSKTTSATHWLDPKLCMISQIPSSQAGQFPGISGAWRGSMSIMVDKDDYYAMWMGLSDKTMTPERIYFALGHPDSDDAKQVKITSAIFQGD